jgi:hypothetical protein
VEYKVTGSGSWTAMASTTATTANITGLTSGSSYDVRVTAYNLIGDASTPSAAATKTAAALPNVVLDTFTRADTTSGLGTSDTGQAWTAGQGTYGISGSKAYSVTAVDGDRTVIETGIADHRATVTVTGNSGVTSPSLIARATDANNGYVISLSTGTLRLFKMVAGAYTAIGSSASLTLADGDTLAISAKGSTITGYKNGVSVITATDTTFAAGTKAGLRVGGNSGLLRYDDFKVQAS